MMYPLVSADYQHLNASVNTARSRNPCSAVIPEPGQLWAGTAPARYFTAHAKQRGDGGGGANAMPRLVW